MAKEKKSKDGKKKTKAGLRKFDLSLFGLLTFTRYWGAPFEAFMYAGDKKKQKNPKEAGKKKKKKEIKVEIPKLPMFPETFIREGKPKKKSFRPLLETKLILPTTTIQYREKTSRTAKPMEIGGSIRDELCGEKYPLPPRPQPHGGVFGDPKCLQCRNMGGLTKSLWGTLHKKMRALLTDHYDKANYIIQFLIDKMQEALLEYEVHMKSLLEEMGPILNSLDDSEWDDHFEINKLVDKWKTLQKQLDDYRAELKRLRRNREDEINKATAYKLQQVEDAERRLMELEREIQKLTEVLVDWRNNWEKRLQAPEDEIAAILNYLSTVRQSILTERDTLRQLLNWENRVASEATVKKMEQLISSDLGEILGWMDPAWFRLALENRKLTQERKLLNAENHLLLLEVETLSRHVQEMKDQKREIERVKSYGVRPPYLKEVISKFFIQNESKELQIPQYPTFHLLHE